jgi:hypothetical protein
MLGSHKGRRPRPFIASDQWDVLELLEARRIFSVDPESDRLTAVLARCLVEALPFLELSGEDLVSTDATVSLSEDISHQLRGLSRPERSELIRIVTKLASQERSQERREFIADLPGSLGLL